MNRLLFISMNPECYLYVKKGILLLIYVSDRIPFDIFG
ncbi:hypothetical protein EUBDOL_00262 [Amedibacillus dolichus DSM 3991]|uniref:Uncharacterized protein n=1 Tax=Amedibacillus dolichus DSM 3991 TaxID=428127 RepID=A8R8C8_9FIRM|nr:hypothetical protein EUBDOL_00262 [Amedibacillus dolichus DSM 3991]